MKTRKLIQVSITYPGIEPLIFMATYAHSSVTKKCVLHTSHTDKAVMQGIEQPQYHDAVNTAIREAFPWEHPQCVAFAKERGMDTPFAQSCILGELQNFPKKHTRIYERKWEC